jgi:4-diphosphocytidyl-2-C-methyl-D-erythritol kinase
MKNARLFDELAERTRSIAGRSFPLRAPAKVNLRLRVLGRFPNGYHDLSMINGTVSLADELVCTFQSGCSIQISVEPPLANTPVEQNLISRVVVAFINEFVGEEVGAPLKGSLHSAVVALPFSLSVVLRKRVPVGGGLGGGSSDAAAVLRLLVSLFAADIQKILHLSNDEFLSRVISLAQSCGADVPYSFFGGFAWVRGTGEHVVPLVGAAAESSRVLLVMPPFSSSTSDFYSAYRARVPLINQTCEEWAETFQRGELPFLEPLLQNDFETVLCELYPAIGEFLSVLRSLFPGNSSITGSGSTLFSVLRTDNKHSLDIAEREISRLGGTSIVASWEGSLRSSVRE